MSGPLTDGQLEQIRFLLDNECVLSDEQARALLATVDALNAKVVEMAQCAVLNAREQQEQSRALRSEVERLQAEWQKTAHAQANNSEYLDRRVAALEKERDQQYERAEQALRDKTVEVLDARIQTRHQERQRAAGIIDRLIAKYFAGAVVVIPSGYVLLQDAKTLILEGQPEEEEGHEKEMGATPVPAQQLVHRAGAVRHEDASTGIPASHSVVQGPSGPIEYNEAGRRMTPDPEVLRVARAQYRVCPKCPGTIQTDPGTVYCPHCRSPYPAPQPEGEGEKRCDGCNVRPPWEHRCCATQQPCGCKECHPAPQPSEHQGARMTFDTFDAEKMQAEVRASERLTGEDMSTRIRSGAPQGEKPAVPAFVSLKYPHHPELCARVAELEAQLAEANAQKDALQDLARNRWDTIERLTSQHNEWKSLAEKRQAQLGNALAAATMNANEITQLKARLAAQEKALETQHDALCDAIAGELEIWAASGWQREVENRPEKNIYREMLDTCWKRFHAYGAVIRSRKRALRPEAVKPTPILLCGFDPVTGEDLMRKPKEPKPATCEVLIIWRPCESMEKCGRPLPCERHPQADEKGGR